MTTSKATAMTKDPICGMSVDEATALHSERGGQTFFFCGEACRQKFLSAPAGAQPKTKTGSCCG